MFPLDLIQHCNRPANMFIIMLVVLLPYHCLLDCIYMFIILCNLFIIYLVNDRYTICI